MGLEVWPGFLVISCDLNCRESCQAYLDTIKKKMGKEAADFKRLAEEKGFMADGKLRAGVKAGQIVT